ncbi:hypothetical protein B566_EDAN001099 [Ephemera danica]|nr:hypothetical protein B566_EDAN001099 [Ephemera danica]
MNSLAAIVCLVIVTLTVAQKETYTTKWDNIDLDKILTDEKKLDSYFNCIMDQGPCEEDGAELKRVLPEALSTGCAKCTDAQRDGLVKVIAFLFKNNPDQLKKLAVKFDPLGIFQRSRPEIINA